MSFMHPEKQRSCKRCGHEWYADQWGRLDSGHLISDRQAEVRREQFRSCPACGSTKVRSSTPPKLGRGGSSGADALPVGVWLDVKAVREADKRKNRRKAAKAGVPLPALQPITAPLPGAWHPDPTGRFELRYWDGVAWTADVSRNGLVTVDPLQ